MKFCKNVAGTKTNQFKPCQNPDKKLKTHQCEVTFNLHSIQIQKNFTPQVTSGNFVVVMAGS